MLGSDQWGISTRPNLQGELLSLHQQAQQLAQAGKREEAFEQWHKLALAARSTGISWLGSWFLSQAAEMYGGRSEKSDALFAQAIEEASTSGPEVREDLFRQRAESCWQRSDFAHMEEYHKERLGELKKSGREMGASDVLLSLSWVTSRRGDYVDAEKYVREALQIAQANAPTSVEMVIALHWLGVVLWDRGDLASAEKYEREALDYVERYFPNTIHVAQILNQEGVIFYRADPRRARAYFERALSVAERVAPDSGTVPDTLNKLAESLIEQGELANAERYELRALAIWQKKTPDGLTVADSLRDLGEIAYLRGDLVKAREHYEHALTIGERLAPESEETARFLMGLGDVARDDDDPVLAEAYFRKALAILNKCAPGNLNYAETLAEIAGTLHRQRRLAEATRTYQEALAELEDKGGSWGGVDEEQSHYRAFHAAYYKDYIDLLVQQGMPERSFEAVEASRARTLLEMLSQSHIDIHQGADPGLLDREVDLRQQLNSKTQYRIRLLTENHTDNQVSTLDQEIADLRERRARLDEEIHTSNPGFAALTSPKPLGFNQIQQLLDPDSVLLEYSLGSERSYLWFVTTNAITVRELPKRGEIESVARRFYHALTTRTRRISNDPDAEMANWAKADQLSQRLASDLSQILLSPVANLISGKRLLIVSDGALHYIPFSALPDPGDPGVPLIVEHEVVNLPSASVLAEIRRANSGRPSAEREIAVLADPVFDAYDDRVTKDAGQAQHNAGLTRSSQRVRRSASDIGLRGKRDSFLSRLVYSRDEAQAILAVTPRAKSLAALDFRANRSTALSPDLAKYRIVHFATHGFLDSKRPEFSGLVFSLVDSQGKPEDGFLGLEDVYNMKLPVDLVVLSGCQTGLGEEISGEGLNGLTRGFMYAGASRVVASVWSVDDFTTSQLMAKFYRAMEQDKMRPAAALRKAQIEIWKHKGWHAPYYWAAFQLQGEWR